MSNVGALFRFKTVLEKLLCCVCDRSGTGVSLKRGWVDVGADLRDLAGDRRSAMDILDTQRWAYTTPPHPPHSPRSKVKLSNAPHVRR